MNATTIRAKKIIRIITIPVLAIAALGILSAMISHAIQPGDFDTPVDFSRTAKAGYASGPAFIKSDGSTLAIVWSDGASTNDNKYYGNIYLKSADEFDGYWREKLKVFSADTNNWGVDPAYVFDTTAIDTIHVVWAQGSGCNGVLTNCSFVSIQYAQCDVSDDYNSCSAPQEIYGGNTTVSFRRPSIVQDDLDPGNLHVVWTDESANTIFYSRGVNPSQSGGPTWTSATIVSDATNGKNPHLAFSNGRLHMVWDAESAGTINYLYDENYTNDVLAASGGVKSFAPTGVSYFKANPGSPTIATVTPNSDLLYIAFDMENAANHNNFALGYVRSINNGTGWTSVRDVPTAQDGLFTTFPSKPFSTDLRGGLQPTLAITYTDTMTHINVIWQYDATQGEGSNYNIFIASRTISNTLSGFDTPWTTPFTLTDPIGGAPRLASASTDSVMPAFTISDPNNGGANQAHLAYLEAPQNASTWDAFYRGPIIGTIDPAYLLDSDTFAITHMVTPTQVVTGASSLPVQTLHYTLQFTNTGNLDAIGVGITDTFNLPARIAGISAPTGGAALDSVNKIITWNGDIPAHTGVTVDFVATTIDPFNLPVTLANTADLWNLASAVKTGSNKIIIRKSVATYYRQYTTYLPLVFK